MRGEVVEIEYYIFLDIRVFVVLNEYLFRIIGNLFIYLLVYFVNVYWVFEIY